MREHGKKAGHTEARCHCWGGQDEGQSAIGIYLSVHVWALGGGALLAQAVGGWVPLVKAKGSRAASCEGYGQ